jgi:sugar lactone lactonase YvrE
VTVYRASLAAPEVYGLSEGPVWDAERERVLWVDINVGNVHIGTFADGRMVPTERLSFPGTVGAVVCSADGTLLVAGARHLHTIRADGSREDGVQVIPDDKASRLNDGGCDPVGRFLVGSLCLDDREQDEQLLRIEGSQVTVIDDDLSLSNGLAWSPDGTRFYSIDTIPGVVWVRDYDCDTGHWGERRVLLKISDGSPDGMCLDRDGNLWIAIWGAGEVRCFTPSGEQLATIEVPAPNTSCVAFVGPELDTLLITTASEQLTPEQLQQYPDSGKLFTAKVGTTGLPVPTWSGK